MDSDYGKSCETLTLYCATGFLLVRGGKKQCKNLDLFENFRPN